MANKYFKKSPFSLLQQKVALCSVYKDAKCYIDKKKKHIMGHIVCATLFVSGRTVERNEVNNNDGNRSNNKAYNLTWLTHAENIQHSYRELRK